MANMAHAGAQESPHRRCNTHRAIEQMYSAPALLDELAGAASSTAGSLGL